MGQLFDHISRVVRAELNSNQSACEGNYLNEGTALVAGGAVTGASIGKVGVLAGGTGYSLGALPLAVAGALTGAALYEALRSLITGDPSSANAAAIGAATGAATSAAIGGVGITVGGSAMGVGMASMAVGGAVVGLGLVGLNRLLQQGIDPEALLDTAIEQMEADLRNARQSLINVMASQKRLQQQCEQAQAEVDRWKRRTRLALKKEDAFLVQEAWKRQKMHTQSLNSLQAQLNQEPDSVKSLKQNLALLAAKIAEAKTMRTNLKAQVAAAKANGQLQKVIARMNASSAMAAFERLEAKVLQMEACSQAAAELAGADLETQFAMLEAGDDVDDELEAMKVKLLGYVSYTQAQLPVTVQTNTTNSSAPQQEAAVDAELEALKLKLAQL